MKTLRLLTVIITISSSLIVNGQKKRDRFGLTFGANFANVNQDYSTQFKELELNTDQTLAFQVGFKVDNSVNNNFSIQPTFVYNKKGYQVETQEVDGTTVAGFTLHFNYLEASVDFLGILDNGMFFSLAPYFAYGMNGKLEIEGIDEKIKLKGKVGESTPTASEDGIFNAPDAGFILGTGFQSKSVQLKLAYSLGLNNTTPKTADQNADDFLVRNRVLSLTVTTFFN